MLTLTITTLSHAAEGIGRHEGRAVFVPFALPGEIVRVEIVEEKKNFARAKLLEVIKPSPDRVEPRCPHHFSLPPSPITNYQSPVSDSQSAIRNQQSAIPCGGCHLQHLAYPAQLAFKQQTLRDQLTRLGGFTHPPVRPIIPAPNPFNYRNHVQFSLTPAGQLGMRAAHSHTLVPIAECHQLLPTLNALFPHIAIEPQAVPELDRVTLRANTEGEALVIFETEADPPAMELDLPVAATLLRPDGSTLPLAGGDSLTETLRGRAFQISAGSFFQINTPLAERLVELVLEGLALTGHETVLDLYCGVGLFTAFIAPQVKQVIGIESYAPAVNDAAINLDEFDNVEIYEARAEDVLPQLEARPDAVVLDPPRAGCAPAVIAALNQLAAPHLVYVACDPATFARDAKLLATGGYSLQWVQPLDLFPQTHHLECVSLFAHHSLT